MAAGAVGVCCQKVSEADALAAGGVTDVLISNDIVGARKLDRVCALAKTVELAICVDAGVKASAFDSGMPGVWQRPGVEYVSESDEHGVLAVASGTAAPALGEKILLVPGHCDPTVNLHDWFVCVRHGVVEALWPVTARGMIW